MKFRLISDSGEKREFGDTDTAVEYLNHRANENFSIVDAPAEVIAEIRRRVSNVHAG